MVSSEYQQMTNAHIAMYAWFILTWALALPVGIITITKFVTWLNIK